MKGSEKIDKRSFFKVFISVILIFSMLAMSAYAAEEEEEEEEDDSTATGTDEYTGQDFVKDHFDLQEAQNEVENGPGGDSVKKVNNYLLYGYVAGLILYMGLLIKWFYADGGEHKAKAYVGAIALILFVMLQVSGTIEALDTIAGI